MGLVACGSLSVYTIPTVGISPTAVLARKLSEGSAFISHHHLMLGSPARSDSLWHDASVNACFVRAWCAWTRPDIWRLLPSSLESALQVLSS